LLSLLGISIICRNQRFDIRSYRICGSLVKFTVIPPPSGVMIDEKKTSGSAFSTPSATPVALLKLRSRPLTNIINCDGPAMPIESGGNEPVSVGPVTPSHCKPIVCEKFGVRTPPAADTEVFLAAPGGICGSNRAAGFCGRFRVPGISNSRLVKVVVRGPLAASAAIMSAVVRLTAVLPAIGVPAI
jgi:hypothetical protein